MRDRKQYWRDYQRERYRKRKSRMNPSPATFVIGPYETFDKLFKRLCVEQNCTGQSAWRRRAKLKSELLRAYKFVSIETQHTFAQRLLTAAKQNARNKKLEFSIEPVHLLPLPDLCPILKTPLEYSEFGDALSDNKPSVDRIDSSLGYVKGNVQVVSWRANRLKNNATLEELRLLGKWAASKK